LGVEVGGTAVPFEMDDWLEGGDRRADMEDKPTILLPLGVAGTTVCVDVVETEDEEDEDEDGAGEHERGDLDSELGSNEEDRAGSGRALDEIAWMCRFCRAVLSS
jgi:hypothetical protein